MSRGPSTFRQQDVTRALKAADAAGISVHRIEIDKSGKIVMVTSVHQVSLTDDKQEKPNEWDEI